MNDTELTGTEVTAICEAYVSWAGAAASGLSARATLVTGYLAAGTTAQNAAVNAYVQQIGESMRSYAAKAQLYADSVSAIGSRSVYSTAAQYYAGEANKLLDLSTDAMQRLNDFKTGTQQLLNNPLLKDIAKVAGPLADAIQLGGSVLTDGLGTDKTAQVATGIVAAEILGALGATAGAVVAGLIGAPVMLGIGIGACAFAAAGSFYGEDIYNSIIKPVAAAIPPDWWDTFFNMGGKVANLVPTALWDHLFATTDTIGSLVNRYFTNAQNWTPPRDPLVLDLNGGGIQTVAIDPARPILFDMDGDGTKHATGWVAAGEAIVVRDINGNGLIDSGRELFGDATVLTRDFNIGQLASNGFEALRDLDLDSNGTMDGKFDANDVAYSSVKLWQDTNQDGISQAGELRTFTELGVASINVSGTASNINLGGGNTQAFTGSFTRTNGQVGTAGTAELAASRLTAKRVAACALKSGARSLFDAQKPVYVSLGLARATPFDPALVDTPARNQFTLSFWKGLDKLSPNGFISNSCRVNKPLRQSIFKRLNQPPFGHSKQTQKLTHHHDGRYAYGSFQHYQHFQQFFCIHPSCR